VLVDEASGRVTIGAGVRVGQLDSVLAKHGLGLNLPVPSDPSVIGAALSGGVGFLLRKTGFVSDSIVSARVVLADGSIVDADDERTPDLMWALRGGGGNFGVVVEATMQAQPVRQLAVSRFFFAADGITEALTAIRVWGPSLPNEITVVAMLRNLPPHPAIPTEHQGRPGLIVSAVNCAEASDLGRYELPGALHQEVVRLSPAELRAITDMNFSFDRFGVQAESGWLDTLDDDTIGELALACSTLPAGHSVLEIALLGGAVAEASRPSSAPGRDASFFFNAMAIWTDPDYTPTDELTWLRSVAAFADRDLRGVAPGFASRDQLKTAPATYGGAFARLRDVKRRYDPSNIFSRNLNILPTEARNV